ncbi:MAG: hypothetical protein M0C28_03945 [Candidatus Moduliflexus flocculans]|nr:hypothetical protein [Candidatus Moduliflexus flocculans]
MLDAEIGAFKNPGANIGQIDVLDAYSVRALIDEHYITRVEAGLKGEFELAGKTFGLKVRRVFPAVRENRFEVDLDFAGEAPPDLRRGQTLHIRLQLGDVAEAAPPAPAAASGRRREATGSIGSTPRARRPSSTPSGSAATTPRSTRSSRGSSPAIRSSPRPTRASATWTAWS